MFKIILPLSLAGLSLVAQPGDCGGTRAGLMSQVQALGITDAQRASFHQVFANHKAALKAKTEVARQARMAFVEALTEPGSTEAQLKVLHDAASDAQFEVLKEGRAMHQEIEPLLTPEQKAKAQDFKGHLRSHLERLHQFIFGN